ncbi:MAG: integrase DNA-binding domain-containing protein [Lachnospiraceae bacterium]|nr:integrase DNA-binding domain-containing protein [Lachnospiraceae bacterium]
MVERRKDIKGRNLKDGEDMMPDGRYRYRYIDYFLTFRFYNIL